MRQDRNTTTRRRWIALATAAAGLCALPAAAQEDKWPSKPIRVIVPFPAGSFTDTVARVLADSLAKSLGQTVIVDNKAGANGVLGLSEAVRQPADGYTLVVTNSSSITINPQIYKKITYKAGDFTPVTMILEAPFVLVANSDWAQKNAIDSAQDLVAHARRNPGRLSYGSAGPGNIAHLSFAMLSNKADVKTTHIPYKSSAAAQMATLSGEIHTQFDTWTVLPHVKTGKVKALAVTSNKRMAQLPDVPTVAEIGYPDVAVTFWIGMLAPAGTPQPIVQKLSALSQAVLQDEKAMSVLSASGDVVLSDPATFAKRIQREVPAWGAVIQREVIALD